jgi:hypothetical protein
MSIRQEERDSYAARQDGKRRYEAATEALSSIKVSDEDTAFAVYCFLLAVLGRMEISLDADFLSIADGKSTIGILVGEVGICRGPQVSLWVMEAPASGAQGLLDIVQTALTAATRQDAFLEGRKVGVIVAEAQREMEE